MVGGLRFELVKIVYAVVNIVHCLFPKISKEFLPQKQFINRYFIKKMCHYPTSTHIVL